MTTRITVTAGDPDEVEVAAVTTAVLALAAAAPPPAGDSRPPAWSRAARLEQVGQAPATGSADPRLVHRPSGALPPGAG